MDPVYYTRIAASSWIFSAIVVLSMWETQSPNWMRILNALQASNSSVIGAILVVIATFMTAPAFGLVLERMVAMLLKLRKLDYWNAAAGKHLLTVLEDARSEQVASSSRVSPPFPELAPRAVLYATMYHKDNSHFVDWSRRQRSRIYSSFTSVLAAALGLLVAGFSGSFSGLVALIAIPIGSVLIWYGLIEINIHRKTLVAWATIYGEETIIDSVKDQTKSSPDTA